MFPSQFEYHRPDSLNGALSTLKKFGDEARVIAGGHSLIPMMKLRLAEIGHLIDLQDIKDLKKISISGNRITLGAMVTQHELINDGKLEKKAPLLREAALQIADPQVRYMGTIGGNVANGDPGNDMPGIMQCLDAKIELVGPKKKREVAAREYFEAAYTTARNDDEILVAISFDAHGKGYAYEKLKRKIGDYATAAAAVILEKGRGKVSAASIAMTNLSDTPICSKGAGDALVGTDCGEAAVKQAISVMLDDIDPAEDNRGPVEFKRHTAGVMLERAIARAWDRA